MRGVVRDRNGATVPGATVTASGRNGDAAGSAKTDSHGEFAISELASGTYTLRVVHSDFQESTLQGLKVRAGRPKRVQIHLDAQIKPPGEGRPVLTTTTSAQINETQLAGLPLNGRSYTQLPAGCLNLQKNAIPEPGGSNLKGQLTLTCFAARKRKV